jgi:hypothetical protein
MSYDDSRDLDRWYEYQESRREEEEWFEEQAQKERDIQDLINSMTEVDYNMVMELNDKLRRAKQNSCYTKLVNKTAEQKSALIAIYNAALVEFNQKTEKWPILKNGF